MKMKQRESQNVKYSLDGNKLRELCGRNSYAQIDIHLKNKNIQLTNPMNFVTSTLIQWSGSNYNSKSILNAVKNHVDDEDKKEAQIQGDLGGTQTMTIINESGEL